jgi:uncharacterized membrane protein
MARATRWALFLSRVAALGVVLQVYSVSPEVVPVHYGPTGIPDRWGPRAELLAVFACVIGVSTALFRALPHFIWRAPRSMLNLPNKEYWLAPEQRASAAAKFAIWAHLVGTSVNVLMAVLQLGLASVPRGLFDTPTPLPSCVVLAFVTFVLGSCVWLTWSYRLPKATPNAPPAP